MKKILILLYIVWFPLICKPCNCIGKSNIKDEIAKSDVILTAKVITKRIIVINDTNLPAGYKMRKLEYKIIITKVYKGNNSVSDTISIITGIGNGDCGYEFGLGSEYIIFATYQNKFFENGSEVSKYLQTDICTRTKLIEKKEIRKIKKCLKVRE